MEEKKEKKEIKVKLSTALLIIALIVICIMGYSIYKLSTNRGIEESVSNNIIEETIQEENEVVNNEITTNLSQDEMKDEKVDFSGIWNVKKAIKNENNEEVNISDIYGSSAALGCGDLTLDKNNNFVDYISPVSDGTLINGTYEYNNNRIIFTYINSNYTKRELIYNNEEKTLQYFVNDEYSLILEKRTSQVSEELYKQDYDEILIRKYDDGTTECNITIYRLTSFGGLSLNYRNQDEATFTTIDPSGENNISGKLKFNNEKNSVTLIITDSLWEYLPIGTSFTLYKDLNKNSDNESNIDSVKVIKTLTPSGFAGSSSIQVVLYSNNEVKVIEYDGSGYEENNITYKSLIATNVIDIEYVGEGENFESIVLKGNEINIIDDSYEWITFLK